MYCCVSVANSPASTNPDDDVIVPMPGEAPGIIRSKMNGGGNSVPPPSPDAAPADNNPFGAPIPEGPLPF